MDLNDDPRISDLCVSCGMCCDGTLFEKATVLNAGDKQLALNLDLTIIEKEDKTFFKLPCHLFHKCCTVYDKVRPNVCGTFFCVPLRNYEKGEIEFELAEKQVLKLLSLKKSIQENVKNFIEFESMPWPEFLIKLEGIINNQKKDEIKKYGILIIFYTAFMAAKNVVLPPKKAV